MGERGWRLALYPTYLKFIDLLFPPRCARCQQLGAHWCGDCRHGVAKIPMLVCPRCGLPEADNRLCDECRRRPPQFDAARAAFRYSARLRPVIVALKYRSYVGLAWDLAQHMALAYKRQDWTVDLVVPVPLADDRLAERGFNQAELLARPLSWLLRVPLHSWELQRNRATPKQVGRTFEARYQNIQGAFSAEETLVKGNRMLLVDDVMTTGATLNAAAAALKAAGADTVYAITVGRATL